MKERLLQNCLFRVHSRLLIHQKIHQNVITYECDEIEIVAKCEH